MNRSEAALLLGMAASRDRRTIGDADVLAWAEDLDDIDFDDAKRALRKYFRESTDWLLPAHIRRIVSEFDRDRRRAALAAAEEAPECEHLVPGGAVLHPISGLPRCPMCRAQKGLGDAA
jgi:hypothetical protein